MYTRINIFTTLVLFSKISYGYGKGENLPSFVYDACNRITDPEYLTISCCPAMDRVVDIINECKGDAPTFSTCSQAMCVVDRYGILTKGKVDLKKAEQALIEVDLMNPEEIPLSDLVRKYCLRSNYTCFPSIDPYCDGWKFMNCAFFASRIACPITYSDCACDDIAEDVEICEPYQRRYVREFNKGCNNECSVRNYCNKSGRTDDLHK